MRLLVATDFNPSSPGGGAAVIRQMLQGFREEGHSIHWWSCRKNEKSIENFSVNGLIQCPIPSKLIPSRRVARIKSALVRNIWAPLASKSLSSTIKTLQPDCVWAIPHNWSILPLHQALISQRHKKMRIHTTIQDYPDIHGNSNRWGLFITKELREKQLLLYSEATTCDATSLPMLNNLNSLTQRRGVQMLHEGLESSDFIRIQNKYRSNAPKLKLAFIGTILAGDEFSLLIDALKLAGADKNSVSLDIWSTHSYKKESWFDSTWMFERGNEVRTSLLEKLSGCDWGCLTMPFQHDQSRYGKYSFPTKFITYLAAGIPTLILGPNDSAVNKMAEEYDLGLRFCSKNISEISNNLLQKLYDYKNRAEYLNSMLACAQKYFFAEKMRKKLWDCFLGENLFPL